MRFLIIGLGSMGKRRIRNLLALGETDIIGYDTNPEVAQKVQDKYNIKVSPMIEDKDPDAVIISTPPDHHNEWIKWSVLNKTPCFVEASVVLQDLEKINEQAKESGVLICPSCTFQFDRYVRKIKQMLNDGILGKPLGFNFHLGQLMLDWHPGQPLDNYYAAKKLTGAAKEMVTFDWTWLFDLFGFPEDVRGFYGKTLDMGCDIDDTYAMALKYPDKLGVMMTDAVAKDYIKRLVVNTDTMTLVQDWREGGIDESMYIDEMRAFIKAVKGEEKFSNTLDKDIKILKLLEKFENENKTTLGKGD